MKYAAKVLDERIGESVYVVFYSSEPSINKGKIVKIETTSSGTNLMIEFKSSVMLCKSDNVFFDFEDAKRDLVLRLQSLINNMVKLEPSEC